MLAIRVHFLHGIVRAGSPDDVAMAGSPDPVSGLYDSGEWPPSPARLFSALVAGGGTGSRSVGGDDSELQMLERADPPQIIADARGAVLATAVCPRFVVQDVRHTGAVHEYIGRTAATVRPGTRLSPRVPEVIYVWPDLAPSPKHLEAIMRRAARVGYLGCSDSPVRVSVSTALTCDDTDRRWVPERSGAHVTPVPYPGFTEALDAAFEQWQKAPVRRSWIPTRRAHYRAPGQEPALRDARPTVFWFLLDPPVAARFALRLTETLREATLDLYERIVGGEVPPILHGHGFADSGRNHAQFLALPEVGSPHSTGRIHGVAVWLPADVLPEIAANVQRALAHLDELVRPACLRTDVRPHGGERRPWAGSPKRWQGPSSRWTSVFPVVHERWRRPGPDKDEVERWFHHAGFECCVLDYRMSTSPLLPGSLRLHSQQVHRQGKSQHPYSFCAVELDREIHGPVVIGRGRQFGMGLMAPQ